ncbi:MAG TPA: bifunctional phosphoribosyl-AMP cyclohydrolase/phosphoribosyl-ATP diphosphatase HisIE [Cytophagales bacterium]|nr:bifunctional phosphoribosyl-AMP cyclohydrolase/phosphoribosyl-ATP diphosphatase HisIE [Cytophagales bacterium]
MEINFEKQGGLVPAVVQDAATNKVLMVGFMNQEAYEKTLAEKKVTFYSRTKERLWTKGESSGHFLHVVEVLLDCDQDTLLIKANPVGPTCHTGADTCFFEKNTAIDYTFLEKLITTIRSRKHDDPDKSYTSSLFKKGINKIAQKVGEEAVEVVIEAKDNNDDLFRNEAADLFFHYLVLLEAKNISFSEIVDVLRLRNK